MSHPWVDQSLLARQPDLNSRMRSILVEWLWDVSVAFRLHAESFFRAIHVLDTFFAKTSDSIPRSKLQLCGIAALFTSSKVAEIYSPEIRDFVYICDRAYTAKEIFDMEMVMLRAIDWNLDPYNLVNPHTSVEEYAAVILAVDGMLNRTPYTSRSALKALGQRIKTKDAANFRCTRNATHSYDPLSTLYMSKIDFSKLCAFYDANKRLHF